jgi:hypothetical protein
MSAQHVSASGWHRAADRTTLVSRESWQLMTAKEATARDEAVTVPSSPVDQARVRKNWNQTAVISINVTRKSG